MSVRCLAGAILIAMTSASLGGQNTYTTLNYIGGKHFETILYHAILFGQLSAAGKEPYLIFSARRCNECDENTSVYIHSPSDGAMKGKGLDDRSAYPGNYYAYDTEKLAARVRMFIGQCTEPSLGAAVWFTHEKIENGSWRDRVFVTLVINGELNSVEAATPLPRITSVKDAVSKGLCREIPPIQKAYTEP
jgi:hypothetical protein